MTADRQARAADLLARVRTFARQRVAPTAAVRDREGRFDRALWGELGETGLLGALLPEDEGGLGLDFGTTAEALFSLAYVGGDLSLCISLTPALSLINLTLGRLGTADQKRRFLPGLISGACVPAVAFSELPHGANPRHLATRAVRSEDTWTIDGRKAFSTNGTEADLYLVLAVTSEKDARKGFSTFFVERKTPGVKVEERMAIDFVRAAPHAIISFTACRVPESNRVGTLDGAIDESSRTLRNGEDALGALTLAGHFARLVTLAAAHTRSAVEKDPGKAAALGDLQVAASQARLQAREVARLWEARMKGASGGARAGGANGDHALLTALLAGRTVTERFSDRLAALLEDAPPEAGSDLARAVRDMALSKIGAAVSRKQLQRLGHVVASRAGR